MADIRPQYNEEAVGANHPTKVDVINRAWNVEHDEDGTHKIDNLVVNDSLGVGGVPDQKLTVTIANGDVTGKVNSDSLAADDESKFQAKGAGTTTAFAEIGVVYRDQSGQAGSDANVGFLTLEAGDGVLNYLWVDDTDDLRISTTATHRGAGNLGTVVGDQASDERTKENIIPISYGLKEIMQLEPIEFDQCGVHKLGFGAQRTFPILPETVFDTGVNAFDDEGNTKLGMKYIQIIPALTKAVQEQQTQIDKLTQTN